MKLLLNVILIVLFCFINIGVCADKVVVIPLISDEKCTGDAISEDVLSGKTFSNSTGKGITGTMPNKGSLSFIPNTTNIPINQGFYNGTGYVEGDPDLVPGNIKSGSQIFGVDGDTNIVDTSDGDAVSSDILAGKKAYVGGSLVTGNVPAGTNANGADGSKSFIIPDGLYTGSKTAEANDTNLTAENIKYGVTIFGITGTNRIHKCGAKITATVWKIFDCYNLAAIGQTTNDDPFTPSWRLNGGYWQWGRKGPDSSQWHTTNTANFVHGPTGPDAGDTNEDAITEWDTTAAPDGFWLDASKTANDPCPAGYRVPTKNQWDGVVANNAQSVTGSWDISSTNYSSARFFGDDLMLPAAGYRYDSSGALNSRDYIGMYWSSTQFSNSDAWHLFFYSSEALMWSYYRSYGQSVRCVAE